MRFALLGSGSEGNALVVQSGATLLLLDCGFSVSETLLRLQRLQLDPASISGILVTHEHSDHLGGVARLARRFNLPVWMTHGTLRFQQQKMSGLLVHEISAHHRFRIGDLEIEPCPVPHDAAEPVQYVFSDGAHRLGVLTDTGHITPHIATTFHACHALVLECNHDAEMLRSGRYPASLKQRVGGLYGHLNNYQSAEFLASLDTARLQHVVAAHLSAHNNTPQLAVRALSAVLSCREDEIAVATQAEGLGWRGIG
ncbi:MAG: MBL fold metallo-hydrolase [Gallionella sp.]|nr:MBL fold metallo-hydrolase [Gallionella sp.]OIO11223.1 MAG: MBL fold metallo-hydrolase [Gallionellaceae bacterium CG1_02_60_325]PIR09682.1 MAG: MBL fold metallo-hydrolase [Gallionellaceae bacterium CG11_big_fil_rev_8_21_14_0_20_60_62]PIY05275.1 MAG: MBL fold metallo-hydrolase [Gallionellaceae bacterium CG_4_10_14_3_um_filter_60_1069]PJC04883.1 MAG: MBL fold metallo-hydrolase [Gallionellaceae bacterium CG_4_9_14_0_8_um_filter_60_335]